MREYKRVSDTMERIVYKYMQTERLTRDYGNGFLLTQTEIHTIQTIGDQDGINITNLAKEKKITKGAASQMIYKLVDKKLVEKKVSTHSDSEVSLHLTALGQKAYEGHMEYHKVEEGKLDLDAPVNRYLKKWKIPVSTYGENQVTLRNLMSHTAGITGSDESGYQEPLPTIEQALEARNIQLKRTPGIKFEYSEFAGPGICQLVYRRYNRSKV